MKTTLVATFAHPKMKGATVEVHYNPRGAGWVVIERYFDGTERARRAPMHVGVAKNSKGKGYSVTGEFIDGYEVYGTYPTVKAAKAALGDKEYDPFSVDWRHAWNRE